MSVFYSAQMAMLRNSIPAVLPGAYDFGGKIRGQVGDITLATQTTADTIEIAKLPKGCRPLFGMLLGDTSLATSTIAIGIGGNTGKYRAAAVFTATDTPTLFGVTSGLLAKLTAEEIVIITIAVASLPAAGNLRTLMAYMME